jgi:hypothetical protein
MNTGRSPLFCGFLPKVPQLFARAGDERGTRCESAPRHDRMANRSAVYPWGRSDLKMFTCRHQGTFTGWNCTRIQCVPAWAGWWRSYSRPASWARTIA